jgi:hypothetical protein
VRWPIQTYAMEQRREGRSGLKPVAVFLFLSEDWSPWIALVRMRQRWPELKFCLRPSYLTWCEFGTRRSLPVRSVAQHRKGKVFRK